MSAGKPYPYMNATTGRLWLFETLKVLVEQLP
jgi:hypothetical protein